MGVKSPMKEGKCRISRLIDDRGWEKLMEGGDDGVNCLMED